MLYQKTEFNNQAYKTCKQCGRQMLRQAKVCPHCYAKQSSIGGIIVKILGVYCVIVLMVIGYKSYNGYEEEINKEASTQENVAQSEETMNDNSEQIDMAIERKKDVNVFEYADIAMEYLKSEIDYDSSDEKCLYVYFEMTNNSDENQAFSYLVTCKAFQNGIELDGNYVYDCDEEKNGSKEIQPGASVIVAEVFELDDDTENVTLEVRPFNVWSDRLLFEKEIRIAE